MKILVVGGGGREHTICWKLAQSPKAEKIYCAPGNAGISEVAECVPIGAMEFEKLADFAEQNGIGVRGHTFIWHSQTPNGMYQGDKSTSDARIDSFIKHLK